MYFDKMIYFDFKCLLFVLFYVEDWMSMVYGLEVWVLFLDYLLVEFVVIVLVDVKFEVG